MSQIRGNKVQDVLILTGNDLSLKDLIEVSQLTSPKVCIDDKSMNKMAQNRQFVEKVADRGDHVYGLTTGVGVRKNRMIDDDIMDKYNEQMLVDHAVGQGHALPMKILNASTILLLNSLAAGRTSVRPVVAEHIIKQLNTGNMYCIDIKQEFNSYK